MWATNALRLVSTLAQPWVNFKVQSKFSKGSFVSLKIFFINPAWIDPSFLFSSFFKKGCILMHKLKQWIKF